MRVSVGYDGSKPIRELLQYVATAEKNGFEAAWLSEQYSMQGPGCSGGLLREIVTLMTILASETNRIKIGSAVFSPYTRHVATYAMAIATLREHFGDRFIFGIGAVVRPQRQLFGRALGNDLARVKEFIVLFRRLLSGENITYNGKTINVQNIALGFNRGIEIPVYLSAVGPKMMELTGEISDGVFLTTGTTTNYAKEAVTWLNRGIERGRRNRRDVDVAAYVLFPGDDRGAMREAKVWITGLVTQSFFKPMNTMSGIDESDISLLAERVQKEGLYEASKYVKEYIVDALAVSGKMRQCVEKLENLRDAGVKQLVLVPTGLYTAGTIQAIGRALQARK